MAGAVKDGAVHFGGRVEEVMGLAEGIETALAAMTLRNIPVWATLGCTNLQSFTRIPSTVKRLVVFADNDEKFAGQAAAYAVAHRIATSRKIEVIVEVPAKVGCDWLDVLNARHDWGI